MTKNIKFQYLNSQPLIRGSLKWVIQFILKMDWSKYESVINFWCDHVENLIRNHGNKHAIARIKTYRLHVTRYLCGSPLLINKVNIRVDKSGIPSSLGPLKALVISEDPNELRLLMTLLILSRNIEGGHSLPDTAPIEDIGPEIDWTTYRSEIRMALDDLGIQRNQPQPVWERFHPSTKKGPNGQALMTSVNDAHYLTEYPNLEKSIRLLGGSAALNLSLDYCKKIDLQKWIELGGQSKRGPSLRKLSSVEDPESKTRVIAIFDYWSQTALKPLHDYFMRVLSRLESDRTFDQNQHFSASPGHQFHSLDLSNATDRFPIGFQKVVIEEIFGKEYAQAWQDIMVSLPFKSWHDMEVMYGAGQPMGAYSSWAVFAVSHHVLVHIASRRSGCAKPVYQLLGDDVVIGHDQVAFEYKQLMGTFGVEISSGKTHTSKYMYEFAKRWYRSGIEISGIPIGGILTSGNFWWRLLPAVEEAISRCDRTNDLLEPGAYVRLLKITGQPLRFAQRLYDSSLLLSPKGERTLRWEVFLSKTILPYGCHQNQISRLAYLNQVIVTQVARSLEENLKEIRKNTAEWDKKISQFCSSDGLLGQFFLKRFQHIPPLGVIAEQFRESKNHLQCLKEQSYNETDILKIAAVAMMSNPLLVLHRRKKDVKAQSQANLTKEIKSFIRYDTDVRTQLLRVESDGLSELFSKQQGYLPSWAREKVSWSHIEALEARRIREGF